MDIVISGSGGPIYEQIATQIKGLILRGALLPGEPLPSMRLLAKELRISVITTKRAYEELEREGFIETIAGKGCYVRDSGFESIREERMKTVERALKKAVAEARNYGVGLSVLAEMLSKLYGEENADGKSD